MPYFMKEERVVQVYCLVTKYRIFIYLSYYKCSLTSHNWKSNYCIMELQWMTLLTLDVKVLDGEIT